MPDLVISPKNAVLTAGQTQQFEAVLEDGSPAPGVRWSVQTTEKPGEAGQIESSGTYMAPLRIFRNRKVVIQAQKEGSKPATALVELNPVKSWVQFVGYYLLFSFLGLLLLLVWKWDALCPQCRPCNVRVSPPVVTLMPGQSQAFTANMPVTWKDMGIPGLYAAPEQIPSGGKAQVLATSPGDPPKTGTAEVFFSPTGGLFLQPLQAVVRGAGSVDLTAVLTSPPPSPRAPATDQAEGTSGMTSDQAEDDGEPADDQPEGAAAPGASDSPVLDWMSPEIGTLTALESNGMVARFSVPDKAVDRPTRLMILARTRETPPRIAGAWVTVQPADLLTGTCGDDYEYNVARFLLLLAIMGALGGLIHGISSFTTYVGNREFLASWVWWYVFKPFLAALVALVVFLVFRAGFGVGDYSLGAADCLKASAFAALIGLFAEQATIKLKDIFETLFTPRNDPRRDEAGKVKPKGPTITSLAPDSVTEGQSVQTLTITGTDFAPGCRVKIGGSELRTPDSATQTQLVVPLQATDIAKPGKVEVTVFNKPPDGDPSNTRTIEVKPKAG